MHCKQSQLLLHATYRWSLPHAKKGNKFSQLTISNFLEERIFDRQIFCNIGPTIRTKHKIFVIQ